MSNTASNPINCTPRTLLFVLVISFLLCALVCRAATPAPEPSAIEPEAPAAGAVAVAEIPADAAPTAPEPSAIEPEALAAGAVAVPEIPADAAPPGPETSVIEPVPAPEAPAVPTHAP